MYSLCPAFHTESLSLEQAEYAVEENKIVTVTTCIIILTNMKDGVVAQKIFPA